MQPGPGRPRRGGGRAMITHKQLQCFAAIVEEGGFTPAARKLYMTQPAVSWQVRALEENLELKLLERSERRVVLTEAGRIFYRNARRILNQYQAMDSEMAQFRDLERGQLRVGASTIPGEYLLAAYLARFQAKYPGVQLQMSIADSSRILSLLEEETVPVGVVGATGFPAGIRAEPFLEDQLVLVAHRDHPLARQPELTPAEALSGGLLLREEGSGTRQKLLEALAEHGCGPVSPVLELGSTRAILSAVEANLGISWVSRAVLGRDPAGGSLVVIPTPGFRVLRHFHIVTRKDRTLSPLARAFIECLRQREEEEQDDTDRI